MPDLKAVIVIGGGLAGSEAAYQIAKRGVRVVLHEMKPVKFSPAHQSQNLAELVCSNSLRSDALDSAVGLLKEEMRRLGSLIMEAADNTKVPAGKALAVDREQFSSYITKKIAAHPLITIAREEVIEIPEEGITIIATGPLTTEGLSKRLGELIGEHYLYFYDAIAPIIFKESIDFNKVFKASRYAEGEGDYLNCPMDEKQYKDFIRALKEAEKVPLKPFEKPVYFEGCLPIEVMAERGDETLRFGPMKPVGLKDPRAGKEAYAVVQLRQENVAGTLYNMVGFQTKLKWPEQERIFRMIPGLEKAEFARLGSIHRNTFVKAPVVITKTLQLQKNKNIFLAGQISGVEGYVESTAMGLIAGINAALLAGGKEMIALPDATAHGALINHITESKPESFQPMNVNFGLFPALSKKMPRKKRGQLYAEGALAALEIWIKEKGVLVHDV
ncbi:MAG: methylenetetrahydrofolate--tRNA-(uracil(54)-C(5))-methyltransferase (FADH(2)-oxidizing) TrmFO [Thermodesulfobacteriota bacterium]|nr:methylenetetrahydrofolate--tRNA-(uracil(54)-C(5))-methyltransferase (FADH(2)-oxidizing) TrmFO [Thermodesulfobacteriota bacterium]